ncbi:hypothetical protein EJB05_24977, partial [Eragrostis curvula]
MAESRNWASLPNDMVQCISDRLDDPLDFISFRAVCQPWREAITREAHGRFNPWILKSDRVGVDGKVLFHRMGSDKVLKLHVPALKGKRTRLAGFGAGHLIAIDVDDKLSAVLVNPLLPTAASTTLPRLPEWCVGGGVTYGFTTDPEMTPGDKDVFVVIYNWWPYPHALERMDVAMWRCGSDAGWATVPAERFWSRMPFLRRRLAEHGPMGLEVLEEDGVGNGAGMRWVPGLENAHLIEHDGMVRFLFREEDDWARFPSPQVTFALQDMIGGENWALVNLADVPELHDKIILQSSDSSCYVLPARDDDSVGPLSKNCIYFFSWQHLEEGRQEYCLCKWDFLEHVSTVVKQMPGVWDCAEARWFLPTLKHYCLHH